jgi:methyl-accepting chemotaxis protein
VARSNSVISVSIIGDAKKLIGALNDANVATGGLIKSALKVAGGALLAGKAVDAVFDIAKDSLENADRFADALDRVARLTTPQFASSLHDVAFSMTDFGLSAPEVAELAASFAAFATAAKVTEPAIETMLPSLLKVAAAVSAQTGKSVAEVVEDIGRAATGSKKVIADYGIVIDKALNPEQQLISILSQLQERFPLVTDATNDFAGAQDELNAKWENFKTKLGEALEGPLKGVLDFFNNVLDDIPETAKGFEDLGGNIIQFAKNVLGPLGNVRDVLEAIVNLLGQKNSSGGSPGSSPNLHSRNPGGRPFSDAAIAAAIARDRERNGLGR